MFGLLLALIGLHLVEVLLLALILRRTPTSPAKPKARHILPFPRQLPLDR